MLGVVGCWLGGGVRVRVLGARSGSSLGVKNGSRVGVLFG